MKPTEETQRRYKKIICDIAKAFDTFCCKHDLRYFAIGGTAIGALRHNGIIPWDDDIDFAMPRPDYERFLTICGELLPKYEMVTHRKSPLYHLSMGKLCDTETSYLASFRQRVMLGAFIDIFPMDGCPGKTKEERDKFFNNYMKLRHKGEAIQNYYYLSDFLSAVHMKSWEDIPRQLRSHWYHLTGKKNPFFTKCDDVLMANDYDTSEYVAYFGTWRGPKVISRREWFDGYYYADFEDFKIRIPKGAHEYLTRLFGDYMTPPPQDVIATDNHGYVFLDLDKRISWDEARRMVKMCKQAK